jgi:hypothetical protein
MGSEMGAVFPKPLGHSFVPFVLSGGSEVEKLIESPGYITPGAPDSQAELLWKHSP